MSTCDPSLPLLGILWVTIFLWLQVQYTGFRHTMQPEFCLLRCGLMVTEFSRYQQSKDQSEVLSVIPSHEHNKASFIALTNGAMIPDWKTYSRGQGSYNVANISWSTFSLNSFPGPAQLSIACSTKSLLIFRSCAGRAWERGYIQLARTTLSLMISIASVFIVGIITQPISILFEWCIPCDHNGWNNFQERDETMQPDDAKINNVGTYFGVQLATTMLTICAYWWRASHILGNCFNCVVTGSNRIEIWLYYYEPLPKRCNLMMLKSGNEHGHTNKQHVSLTTNPNPSNNFCQKLQNHNL